MKRYYYIYILSVRNLNLRSRKPHIYYTGQTINIAHRLKEHLEKRDSNYLKYNFPQSVKQLVYVEYVYGTLANALMKEQKLNRLSPKAKVKLIGSKKNELVKYMPFKAIILKKYNHPTEQICLKL